MRLSTSIPDGQEFGLYHNEFYAEVHGIPNRQLPDGSCLWTYGRGGDGDFSAKSSKK